MRGGGHPTAALENAVLRAVKALEASGLEYVLVGGFAAIFWGRPRTTMDVDVIVQNDPSKFPAFLASLRSEGFDVVEEQFFAGVEEEASVSMFDEESPLRLDLKVTTSVDEREVLEQAVQVTYAEMVVRIASVEQVLYEKILYLGDVSDVPDSERYEVRRGVAWRCRAVNCLERLVRALSREALPDKVPTFVEGMMDGFRRRSDEVFGNQVTDDHVLLEGGDWTWAKFYGFDAQWLHSSPVRVAPLEGIDLDELDPWDTGVPGGATRQRLAAKVDRFGRVSAAVRRGAGGISWAYQTGYLNSKERWTE